MSEIEESIRDALRARAGALPASAERLGITRRRVTTRRVSKIASFSALAVVVAFSAPAMVGRLIDTSPRNAPAGVGQEGADSSGDGQGDEEFCYDMRRPPTRGDSTKVTGESGEPPTVARGTFGDLPWKLELVPAEQEQDFETEEGEEDPAEGEEQTPPGELELVLRFEPDTYGSASMPAERGDSDLVYSHWQLRDNSGIYMFGSVAARATEVRADVIDEGSYKAQLFQVWDNTDQGMNDSKFFVVFLPLGSSGTLIAVDDAGSVIVQEDFDSSDLSDLPEIRIEGAEECEETEDEN